MERKQDYLDRIVIFLAKRDGIDKLVKTFQYVSKLLHWHMQSTRPDLADKAKKMEVSCGLSRKAFRTGRFLSGLNGMRSPAGSWKLQTLSVLANGGEMVYFFFDHFTFLSRIGVLEPHLGAWSSFISASGEAFGYIFAIVLDLILIRQGLIREKRHVKELSLLVRSQETKDLASVPSLAQQITQKRALIAEIRMKRIMQLMAISANLADFIIAIADIRPNPFANHPVTLGISGLVSAWAGWYRNWPAST